MNRILGGLFWAGLWLLFWTIAGPLIAYWYVKQWFIR